MSIKDILTANLGQRIEDEDGDELAIKLASPVAADELKRHAAQLMLPEQFVELYEFTNGLTLFSAEVYDMESLQRIGHFIPFHPWGNGDFTCVCTGGDAFLKGEIIFMRHSECEVYPVVATLSEWLVGVIREYETHGTLAHPIFDYPSHQDGVYQRTFTAIQLDRKG